MLFYRLFLSWLFSFCELKINYAILSYPSSEKQSICNSCGVYKCCDPSQYCFTRGEYLPCRKKKRFSVVDTSVRKSSRQKQTKAYTEIEEEISSDKLSYSGNQSLSTKGGDNEKSASVNNVCDEVIQNCLQVNLDESNEKKKVY